MKGRKASKDEQATSAAEHADAEPLETADEPETSGTSDSALDADNNYAPESLVEEEERLRQEREGGKTREALQEAFATAADATLDDKNFDRLNKLIEQTNLYTQFLTENLAEAEENVAADTTAAGTKRKAGNQVGRSSKRAKADAKPLTETQKLLPLIKGELRDYQLKGVKWMHSLYQNGINGILADQMGLGKTVQTIGFLSYLYNLGMKGPFMILGPLSTLPNWVSEFKRWAPSIPCVMYHGNKQERADIRNKRMKLGPNGIATKEFPVIITSYEIVIADIKFMQKFSWKYIVVDEGHRLKNFDCKLLRELRTLDTANKLILSGTPLQNNLAELWSLLNFLLPDIFRDLAAFEGWFDFRGITDGTGSSSVALQEQQNQVVSKLHAVLRPFLLRRIKSDVENNLPAKKEIILYSHMTDKQKKFNEQLRDRTLNEVMARLAKEEGGSRATGSKLNNMIMQMRKNCNHPDLISSAFSNEVYYPSANELLADSGKLQLLDRLLVKLKQGGHKVLIFSQMTKMLDLLDAYLEEKGHRSVRLDGSVKWQDRQQAMKEFNSDPDLFCFLLSTRAGGLGINLTAADTVIIYDSDWNPHQDMQAMDRCHRIGQVRPVLVLRLAAANSVDGRMLKRANSKLMLERLVIKKGAFLPGQADANTSLSNEELLELLKDSMPLKDEPQAGVVSDKMLDKLLDRTHMEKGTAPPYKDADIGYEVVQHTDGSGLLSTVE